MAVSKLPADTVSGVTDGSRATDDDSALALRTTRQVLVLANLISAPYYVNTQVPFGLAINEWRTLRQVCDRPGVTQTEISEISAQNAMALSRAVGQLMRKRLVEGRTDPDDRRRTLLYPTELGCEITAEIASREAIQARHIVGGLDDDEAEQLRTLVDKLTSHIRSTSRPEPPPASRDWRALLDT